MSNRNPDESSGHRKPKVSLAMTISQGLGGPKGKPKGVPDGQPVNIPVHPLNNLKRTESSTLGVLLDLRLSYEDFPSRPKISFFGGGNSEEHSS